MPLSDAMLDGLTGIVGPGAGADEAGRRHPVRVRRDGGAQAAARGGRLPADAPRTSRAACSSRRAKAVPIVTRGSGTGLSGGSVPSAGAMVLCLAQMNAILDVDPRNLTLRAQPGVTTITIDEAAARHGLFYPPDPGLDAHQHHRRQRRRELRRAARAEVRRHARLRDGARSRAGRRPDRAVRQPVREGRRRLLDEGPVRRIRRARSGSSPRCC